MSKLIVYDWDDTLLPSSELYLLMQLQNCEVNNCKLSAKQISNIKEIDQLCTNTFMSIVKAGIDVIIVTNADSKWIDLTGPIFLPKIYKYVKSNNIPTISAADLYKSKTKCTTEWKYFTFIKFFEESTKIYDEMISIGDSNCEKQATLWLEIKSKEPKYKRILPKRYSTIKMIDRDPTSSKILDQAKVIKNILKVKCEL